MMFQILVVILVSVTVVLFQQAAPVTCYHRSDFPPNFVFGASSSAFQVEGAVNEDGRTPSILDAYISAFPAPDVYNMGMACDQYHKYKEDVKLMAETGLDAYRMSISWSRLIPNGRGAVNPKAVEYYNNLLNELVNHGIQPHVTLLHMDLPQALEDEYGGWINRQIIKDFTAYADVCFREFGDRVLHWTTQNEPNVLVVPCYDTGIFPPQRCSAPFGSCTRGNSSIEPYIAAHNMLLAHASVVKLYRKKYQIKQNGYVGMNLFAAKFVPETNTTEDILATQRGRDFQLGWFLDPLVHGDYPDVMKMAAGNRIPSFTERESKVMKNSFDFIGINCYSDVFIKDNPNSLQMEPRDVEGDSSTNSRFGMGDARMVLRDVLEYFKQDYENPPIYVHENGYPMTGHSSLDDTPRLKFLNDSIGSVLDAIRNGSNARGYFVWSFMDTLELLRGYQSAFSFGLYHVDFSDPNRKRSPKFSAHWYSSFLKRVGTNVLQFSNSNDFDALQVHLSAN